MGTKEKTIKIVVLDDSHFYNKLLTKQIENYTKNIEYDKEYKFTIESYVHSDDFLRNLKEDIDIAFVDYYLGEGVTGSDMIKQIKKQCKNCKVIIISKARNVKTTLDTVSEGAMAFIYKDKNALARACFFVDHIASNKFAS